MQAPTSFKRSGSGRVLGRIRVLALLAAAVGLDALAQHIRMCAFERLADQLPAVP